ncbi:MAG: DMT family transporter [Chloroflexota bacterium]|jgi:drug/metabolite transporter (DMT)-like permease|nr:DMT family transporter [Chloroflexota bacterium]MDH5242772.1 DMT family transporter [Chloroflexota bacterium]
MPLGLLTGLGAALAWGTLDVFSAVASRRIGSLKVTTGIQVIGAAFVILVAILSGTAVPDDPRVLVGGAIVGLAGAGAYLAYFTGLRIGPIAVVSGMVAAYGGLTVVLAVVIRGETLTTIQAVGAASATIGVILTGVHFDGGWRGTKFASPGVIFAVVALVLFATMAIGSDIVIDYAGWLEVLLVARTTNAVLSVAILVAAVTVARRIAQPVLIGADGTDGSQDDVRRVDARVIGLVGLAGLLDVLGLVVFMYGLEQAETWLVGLASSFGPAVTIIAAVAFMGERLRGIQWVGLALVLTGMIAIGLP